MSASYRSVRYPAKADSPEELSRVVADCPPWAVGKFVVVYDGETLDYGRAAALVKQAESKHRQG